MQSRLFSYDKCEITKRTVENKKRWWQSVTILHNRPLHSRLQLPLPMGELDLNLTRFFQPIPAHNPNGISIGSAVFAQLTTECHYALQQAAPFPLITTPSHGEADLKTRFFRPIPAHNPNAISIGSAVLAQMTTERPYTLQQDALPPQNCPFPWGDVDHHLIHGSLGLPESPTQTASQLLQPFWQGSLVWQTNIRTDWQTTLLGA